MQITGNNYAFYATLVNVDEYHKNISSFTANKCHWWINKTLIYYCYAQCYCLNACETNFIIWNALPLDLVFSTSVVVIIKQNFISNWKINTINIEKIKVEKYKSLNTSETRYCYILLLHNSMKYSYCVILSSKNRVVWNKWQVHRTAIKQAEIFEYHAIWAMEISCVLKFLQVNILKVI